MPNITAERRTAWIGLAILLPVLALKLRFLLRGEAITGWDTPGHLQMSGTYAGLLFGSFDSLGHDPSWFGGYPAFYFYPPLLYFGMAHLQLIGLSVEAAFGVGMFASIVLVGWAYLRWTSLLLQGGAFVKTALAVAAAAFYLAYPGDGHQGVSVSGALGGTVASTLAHGIAVLGLHRLELVRRDPSRHNVGVFIALGGLLFYTHLLTCVFFFGLVGLYVLIARRDLGLRTMAALLAGPIAVGLPIIGLYLGYSHFSDMIRVQEDVPGVLAVVGVDSYLRVNQGGSWLMESVRWFKWVPLVMLGLWGAGFAGVVRSGERRPSRVFLLVAALLCFLVTQDATAHWLFGGPGIHWYRAYALFFGLFAVFAVCTLDDLLAWLPEHARRGLAAALAAGAIGLLLVYDFAGAAGVPTFVLEETEPEADTVALEDLLQGLRPGSLILPEKAQDTGLYGSPHALDVFIQRAGHRNALGLPVQCSLTARLHYAFFEKGMAQLFQYGIDETWSRVLFAGTEREQARVDGLLADYLRRAGVQYVLGRTATMRSWLEARPREFAPVGTAGRVFVYEVLEAAPLAEWRGRLPIGFVSYGTLVGSPPDAKRQVSRFLVEANRARIRLGDAPPIVNLDPVWGDVAPRLAETVEELVVYHAGRGGVDPRPVLGLGLAVPLTFVNAAGPPQPIPGVRFLDTQSWSHPDGVDFGEQPSGAAAVEQIGQTVQIAAPATEGCTPVVLRQSYFPDWRADVPLLQTDTNQIYACAPGGRLELRHGNPLSKLITLAMYALLLGLGWAGRGWLRR